MFLCWFSGVSLLKSGKGRLQWSGLEWQGEVVFKRGHSFWTVTPDGGMRVTRAPEEVTAPVSLISGDADSGEAETEQ